MSEEQKKQLQQQLWNIANTLRVKMDADEFRDYIVHSKKGDNNKGRILDCIKA